MRREPTPAEDTLWQRLRGSALGVHFRRQHVVDRFIVDFICVSKRLVVELDGAIHDDPHHREADGLRDAQLIAQGFRVVRYRNEWVLLDPDGVVADIRRHLADGP